MSVGVLVLATCVAPGGVFLALGARRLRLALDPTRAVAGVSVAALREGARATVAGELRAVGEPIVAANGVRCVAVHTELAVAPDARGEGALEVVYAETRATQSVLTDARGDRCALALDGATLAGEVRVGEGSEDELSRERPELLRRYLRGRAADDRPVRVTETIVPDGARAVVRGEVAVVSLDAGGGYRDVQTRFGLRGTSAEPLRLTAIPHALGRLPPGARASIVAIATGVLLWGVAAAALAIDAGIG